MSGHFTLYLNLKLIYHFETVLVVAWIFNLFITSQYNILFKRMDLRIRTVLEFQLYYLLFS